MNLKKYILDLIANPDRYSYEEFVKMSENVAVIIFITAILLFIFFCILLILFILSLWQAFFSDSLLIEWNILGIFISISLGIISVLLGTLSVLMSEAKTYDEIINSLKEKDD